MSNSDFAIQTLLTTDGVQFVDSPAPQKVVDVKIKYPKDFSKQKYLKDGDIKKGLSEETAALFVKDGIGQIVTDEATADEVPADEVPTEKKVEVKGKKKNES